MERPGNRLRGEGVGQSAGNSPSQRSVETETTVPVTVSPLTPSGCCCSKVERMSPKLLSSREEDSSAGEEGWKFSLLMTAGNALILA